MIKAIIHEYGNGFPGIGDLVCEDGIAYKITGWDGSDRISTHSKGYGNSVYAVLEEYGDLYDITDEEYEQIKSHGCRIRICEQ